MIIHHSVGLSIGSVHPNDNYTCVRNVTFKDSVLYNPLKGIYVKTNSGTTNTSLPGSGGEITNITYENIEIHNPMWWGIYIGPQQQKQPDGVGDGCMLYPLGGCETQPLITIADVTLRNITQYGTWLPPGIIRCNETNPCTGFVFDNVNSSGWWKWLGLNYITEHIVGTVTNSKPDPGFNASKGFKTSDPISEWRSMITDELFTIVRDYLVKFYTKRGMNEHEENQAPHKRHHGHSKGHKF